MVSNVVVADNIYSPYLTQGERQAYSNLMKNFMALCDVHNGSEHANDSCVDGLILAEDFMRSVLKDHPDNIYSSDENEQLFYRQVLGASLRSGETPPDYNQLLDRIAAKFNAKVLALGQQQDLGAVFSMLEQAGAVIVRESDAVFVKTDPSRASIQSGDDERDDGEINKPAPKFSEVITALQAIGIFANQMIIHEGVVSKDMVRNAPYHIIQIPELDCEIAVCDRIGEAIFVNRPLVGPHLFKMHDKAVLENAFGMKRITYRGNWQEKLLGHVLGNAPADKSQRLRVDTKKFAKQQGSKATRLIEEMLLIAMLEYAAEEHQRTGVWQLPKLDTEGEVPGMALEKWGALNNCGQKGMRGIEQGMTLSAIQQIYGLKAGRKVNQKAVEEAVKNWKNYGKLPQKIEVKPLTVEQILIAMLEYAAEEHQRTGVWSLPTGHTAGAVPGIVGENWGAISASGFIGGRGLEKGMTLPVIQRIYGLKAWYKVNRAAVENAVKEWKGHGRLPKKIEVKPLTVERVLIAMLEYAAENYQKTGTWGLPTEQTKAAVPNMEAENWRAIAVCGHQGFRGFEKGMSLPAIQNLYGLKTVRTINRLALEKAVKDWKENGILPQRIDVAEPISIRPALAP